MFQVSEEEDQDCRDALHILLTMEYLDEDYKNMVLVKLLESDYDPNKLDKHGFSPLHLAVQSKNFEALDFLIAFGGDINAVDSEGRTPIFYHDEEEELFRILEYNPDIHVKDMWGYNLIHLMCKFPIAGLNPLLNLIEMGADCTNVNFEGDTCLHSLIEYQTYSQKTREEKFIVAKMMMKKGAKLNTRNDCHQTTLHKALLFDPNMIRLLLVSGAKLDYKDLHNLYPLDYAIIMNNGGLEEIVRFLIFRKHRGLPLDQKTFHQMQSMECVQNLIEEFEQHIEDLKHTRIVDTSPITLYDIIKSSKRELIDIIEKPEMKHLSSLISKFEFGLEYEQDVIEIIEEGFKNLDEMKAIKILDDIFDEDLPYLCTKLIVSFLEKEDIKNLEGLKLS